MALDLQAQAVLAALAGMPPLDFAQLTAPAYRAMLAAGGGFAPGDTVAAEEDLMIPTASGPLAARLYRPVTEDGDGSGLLPLTVFFHGGGFVSCGFDTHANLCRCLAQRARTVVLSVDYRLAPEARFPAAALDACDAVRWAASNSADLRVRPGAIAVAGDSAGGNLAAVAAQQLRHSGVNIAHQVLFYPVVDCATEHPSYELMGDGYLLTAGMMRWFKEQYFAEGADRADPLASPLAAADLTGVASATIISAEYDPLRDEAEHYAARLAQAGVLTTHLRWPGQMHGFASLLGALDAADHALTMAAQTLRHALHAQNT
ncbi:Carboxylesterase NlhH [Paraburkholderia domus]|jgi:Esterase/lipase|uniref:alpha/beta hydrolase n=1 Tax=Paraburkholderia domus TaxID=2793075 RepID=UPI001912DFA5|nr:alpha/beta hydrolase [Paraburkholderia domus]MBK5048785.1 alpha/beta hydrolase [Burkholderia sp. R-70006]CAE6728831.1 Carboxylesterase NlhH [Paraburkholderia domus]CAE6847232.1 Carboxylesterase NlhH [Paraburkholderia domus]